MKKYLFFITGIVLSFIETFPQNSLNGLSLGDPVPEIYFTKIIYAAQQDNQPPTAKLSDFKGKVVILDFWATWCSPCVKGLPKMIALQKKYRDDVIVLPVSMETEKVVRRFFYTHKELALPSILDTAAALKKYFPHTLIPHVVVINKQGIVSAITSSGHINDSIVQRVINGSVVDLTAKKDIINYDIDKPLFLNGNGSKGNDQIIFRSMVTAHEPGLPSEYGDTYINGQKVGFHYINNFLIHLYLYAYSKPFQQWLSRCYYEYNGRLIPYHDSLPAPEERTDEWLKKNVYTYDIIAPEMNDSARYHLMQYEIKRLYALKEIDARIQQLDVPSLLLQVDNEKRISSEGKISYNGYAPESDTMTFQNCSLKDLPAQLEPLCQMPVIDDTHLQKSIDLQFRYHEAKEYGAGSGDHNQQLFNRILKSKGLKLVKGVRTVEIVVLHVSK